MVKNTIQLSWQFFQIFVFVNAVYAQTWRYWPEKLYRATLKGHSQLWDHADLDTTFARFEKGLPQPEI